MGNVHSSRKESHTIIEFTITVLYIYSKVYNIQYVCNYAYTRTSVFIPRQELRISLLRLSSEIVSILNSTLYEYIFGYILDTSILSVLIQYLLVLYISLHV